MSLSEDSASQKFKSLLPAASTFHPFQDVALDSMVSMLLIFQSEKLSLGELEGQEVFSAF